VLGCGKKIGIPAPAPHDLRRTFAKLAHKGRAGLEQIQLNLGHASWGPICLGTPDAESDCIVQCVCQILALSRDSARSFGLLGVAEQHLNLHKLAPAGRRHNFAQVRARGAGRAAPEQGH
jgi:hypothetical protein